MATNHDRDWSTIRHFRQDEFIHNPDLILWDTVTLLDEMRDAVGAPIHVHVAWDDSGHVEDSSHYAGSRDFATAVDFHIEGLSLLDQWLFTERYPWNGIGIYPFWKDPGLHVDLRRLGRDHPHLGKRWWRNEAGAYESISRELFRIILAMPAAKGG